MTVSSALCWMAVGAAFYQALLANVSSELRRAVNDALEGQGNSKLVELAAILFVALLFTLA